MKIATFALLTAAAVAQTPSGQNGSIAGTIFDAVTHQPVKKAMVLINTNFNPLAGGQPPNNGPQSAATDVSGAFSLENLPPGTYQVDVQHQSYNPGHKSITVNAGEKAGPVNVDLIPMASVSGRILDEDGDPLNGCFVQVHPAAHPEQFAQGSMGFYRGAAGDEGQYRVYGIPAGKYILTAQCSAPAFQPRPFSAGPEPPPSLAYPMQYYPLASEAKSAQVIELAAGAERTGVDFRMRPAPVTFVRGIYSPAGSGANMNVQLMPANPKSPRNFGFRQMPDPTGNSILFQMVFPGSYVLAAYSRTDNNHMGALQRIEVKDRPIETVIELKHGVDVSGIVEIEGNTNNKVALNQINLQLVPEYQIGGPPAQTQVNNDGTFTIKSVLPAPWRLNVNGPNVFLKSAWLGATDVTGHVLDFSSGTAEALKLILSTNMATIKGTAPAGQMIWLQAAEDSIFQGGQGSQADQTGQFTFQSVVPGKYRVATPSPGEMPNEGGQEVTVHEGETVTIEVKPPAQQF